MGQARRNLSHRAVTISAFLGVATQAVKGVFGLPTYERRLSINLPTQDTIDVHMGEPFRRRRVERTRTMRRRTGRNALSFHAHRER